LYAELKDRPKATGRDRDEHREGKPDDDPQNQGTDAQEFEYRQRVSGI